jgi:hypothetical protein
MMLKAKATDQCPAGYYRLWSIRFLYVALLSCLVIPCVGPWLRRGLGDVSNPALISVLLTILVSFILPCVSCIQFYWRAEGWRALRDERIYVLQGRGLMGFAFVTSCLVVAGLVRPFIFADYEKPLPITVPSQARIAPPEMSLENQVLIWFTFVSIGLFICFLMGLMPTTPFAIEQPSERTGHGSG